MFWFQEKKNVDNAPVFIFAKQSCTKPSPFSPEGPKSWGGKRIRIPDLKWPKGYSMVAALPHLVAQSGIG